MKLRDLFEHEEFSAEEQDIIKNAPFPEKARANIRSRHEKQKRQAWVDSHKSDNRGGDSFIGTGGGGGGSDT